MYLSGSASIPIAFAWYFLAVSMIILPSPYPKSYSISSELTSAISNIFLTSILEVGSHPAPMISVQITQKTNITAIATIINSKVVIVITFQPNIDIFF